MQPRDVLRPRALAQTAILLAVIAVQIALGIGVLRFGLNALTSDPTPESPLNNIDLWSRHTETQQWFRGEPVYATNAMALYPPGSYSVLALALGWLSIERARWLWAGLDIVCLVVLATQMVWIVGARATPSGLQGRALALVPPALLATRVCLGLGQVTLLVICAVVGGLAVLLSRTDRELGWSRRLLGASLLLVALVKPSLSLPFLPLLLGRTGWRTWVSVGALYAGATLLAWLPQRENGSLIELVLLWHANSATVVASNQFGYANVHWWLSASGLSAYNSLASILLLAVCTVVMIATRRGSLGCAIAVCALVARLWTYHSSYDDLLLALPLAALAGEALATQGWRRVVAGLLFALNWIVGLDGIQARLYGLSPVSFSDVMGIVWIVTLAWLVVVLIGQSRLRARMR